MCVPAARVAGIGIAFIALLVFRPGTGGTPVQALSYTSFVSDVTANQVSTAAITSTGSVSGKLHDGGLLHVAVDAKEAHAAVVEVMDRGELRERLAAELKRGGNRGDRLEVVHGGRATEGAGLRGEGRLEPRLAAEAFE